MAKKQTIKIRKKYGLSGTNNLSLGFPTAQNAETIAFNKDILEAKRLGLDNLKTFNLGTTKGILSEIIGDKKVRITGATIQKAMSKDDSHIITWENLINLPDYLNNPLAIFKSKTAGFVVLTEIINTKNKPIIAPLHIVRKRGFIEVKSLYSRKNDSTYKKWTEQNLLLYINKNSKLTAVVGTIPTCGKPTIFTGKDTKKIITSKKKGENLSLGLPLTDEIRKQAFTDKGKLRKGWYYDEYGLLTDGKEFYHSDKKSWAELENIRIYALDKTGKQIDALYKGTNMKQSSEDDKEYLKILDFEEKLIKKYQITEEKFFLLKQYLRNFKFGYFDFYFRNSDFKRFFKQKLDFRKKNEFVEKVVGKDEFHLTDKGLQMFQEYKDFLDKLNAERAKQYNKYKKKYGLSGVQIELSTEDFKSMTVKELRAFTLQYYLENFSGKSLKIKDFINVEFYNKAGRKLLKPIYKEKVAVMEHLEQLIKNSTYNNWGDRKPTDSQDVLGYLNFKSKLVIDGEKKHIRISFIVNEKRKVKFKTFEVGTKPKKRKSDNLLQRPSVSCSHEEIRRNKDTKK